MTSFSDDRGHRNEAIDRLVEKSQKGDTEAFAQLYDIFVLPVYRYIYYRVDESDVEDLTETVFLKAWEHMTQYRKTHVSFAAWLFKIARNLVIDHYRARNMSDPLDHEVPDERTYMNPIFLTENKLHNATLKTALGRLQESYQQVILLKFMNDLSNSEISEIMGRTEGNVRVLQFRALQALKEILEKMGMNFS